MQNVREINHLGGVNEPIKTPHNFKA